MKDTLLLVLFFLLQTFHFIDQIVKIETTTALVAKNLKLLGYLAVKG